mmetsp:Transcript_31346/g.76467  ORF Transcript_31346/g.76467 Transcript_31346/m.76467 type:complete len:187 (-) Transcript_31346:225-785(-)|eukprot:CAMPEP_0114514530 /NCGR_PEP_ID=MMETSP0109-20121206/16204_1 /TAXON_ID=29199 /ORGANISM="Chlorarachnion reptans, Strain CCCM449" /LENGTH=186 /DNA_ID=CAMNT_0001694579 /DNA_START=39 /DNA_END=599 /DNA_ORIENTATION=-
MASLAPALLPLFLLSAAPRVRAAAGGSDICDAAQTTLVGDQQAVTCYTGNFLTKMLGELNAGQNKTAEHVRVHLLPYLGGKMTLEALQSDDPDDPTCKVCYTDVPTSQGLTGLRNSLTEDQISGYDSINVCYARLTDAIMDALPKSYCGVWLKPLANVQPFDQVVKMMQKIFETHDPSLCPSKLQQ